MSYSKYEINAYYDGVISGVTRYAWQKGGERAVGASETKLTVAIQQVESQRQRELEAVDNREDDE